MLSSILAYILSVAMLTGAAGLPATPDTLNTATFENVVIRVEDESFALDSRAVFSAAAGMEESLLGFCLDNGGAKLFPLALKITPEAAAFSISEKGSAFRITDQALMEMLGLTAEDLPEVYQGEELQQMMNGLSPKAIMEQEDAGWAFLCAYEGAEVTEGSVNVEGNAYPGTTVIIEDGYSAICDLLDNIAAEDYGELSKYINDLRDVYREELGAEGDSFAEIFAENAEEYPSITMELNRTDADGETFENMIFSIDEEYAQMELSTTSYGERESMLLDMEIKEEYFTISADMSIDAFNIGTDEDKQIDADLNFVLDTASVISGTDDADHYISTENNITQAEFGFSMAENGNETACSVSGKTENRLVYDDNYIDYISCEDFALDALVTRGEGNVHIKADLTADLEAQDLDVGLEFDINTASEAYADPFAGRKTVDFSTPDELTGSGQFMADGMALAMDAMRIGLTKDAKKIGEIAALINAPKEVSEEKYAAVVRESGLDLPEFTLPDGWRMKDADVFEDRVKLEFASAEEEFEVTVSRADGIPEENLPHYLYWGEDQSVVFGARLIHGDLFFDFWFNYMDSDFAHEIISGIKSAE